MTPLSTENRWYKRKWTIDDAGIHEMRRDSFAVRISWGELESLTQSAFSGSGRTIRVALDPKTRRSFMRAAEGEWKTRYPQRYLLNRERGLKQFKIATFVVIPIMLLAPAVALWILVYLFHRLGIIERRSEVTDKAVRLTLASVAYLVAFWVYAYVSVIRKYNRNGPSTAAANT